MKYSFVALSFVIIGFAVFNSCGSQATVAEEKSQPSLKELSEDQLFAGDVVRRFRAGEVPYLREANKLFLEAIDTYRNKKDAEGAVPLFIQSICKNPVDRSYYELGNAYMDTKDYKSAIQCFQMAEKLGYEPFSKVLFNLACAHSMNGTYEEASQFLEYSIRAGYTNLDNIRTDHDLDSLRINYSWPYNNAMKSAMNGMSNPEKLFWLQFKKPFALAKLPLFLNGEKQLFEEKDDYIPYDFEKYISEMRDEKFSREVGRSFYYSVEVAANDKFVALIYAEQDAFREWKSGDPVLYRLVTFSPEGKLIDKKIVAGRMNYSDDLLTVRFDKDLKMEIKTYALTYTKNAEEEGYDDNPIKSRDLKSTDLFRITPQGTIEPVAEVAASL